MNSFLDHTKTVLIAFPIIVAAFLSGCGGGGGGSSNPPQQSGVSITGIVASGNAAVGVVVTLVDANGMTVTSSATTATGSYVFPAANYVFPVVVSANTPGGLLVSVLAPSSVPAGGSLLTINVTTLTTAVASLLTNGQPNNTALLKTVTPAAVAAAIGTLDGILGNVLAANGVSSNFNPMTDPLTANGTGQDAVINAVTIVPGTSGPTLILAATAPGQPQTAGVVLNSGALATPPTPLSPPPAPTTHAATPANYLDYVQAALQDCGALQVSQRTNSLRCADIVNPSFLQNGYNSLPLAVADLASPLSVGATFSLPKTLFFHVANAKNLSVVRIYYTLNDGTQSSFTTVAQQLAAPRTLSNGTVVTWDLIGNQQIYDAGISARLQRSNALNTAAGDVSTYLSGLVFNFNPNGPNASNINSVNITGPGLPNGGVWMRRSIACNGGDNMALMGTLPTAPPTSTAPINSTTSFYRMDWAAISNGATVTPGGNGVWAAAPVAMNTLPLYAAYTFTPYDATGTALTPFVKYNLAPPTPAAAGKAMAWNSLSSAFVAAFLTPNGSKSTAQATAAVIWTVNAAAAPAQTVYVDSFQSVPTVYSVGNAHVAPTATSVTVSPATTAASGVATTCPGQFTPLQSAGDSHQVQLRLHDNNGLQVVDSTFYNVNAIVTTIPSSSISGTVSYAGTQTGPVSIAVYNASSCGIGCGQNAGTYIAALAGTAGAYASTYTVRGLQPGNYKVVATMDALATGAGNTADPVGSATTSISTVNTTTTANVTLADPATIPAPVAPNTLMIYPGNASAFVLHDVPTDVNGNEIAASYTLAWGTNAAATVGGGSYSFAARGANEQLNFQPGLTNASVLYFKLTAVNAAGSATSAVTALPVTIGATTGANTLSGTVTFSGTATGPMLVLIHATDSKSGLYYTLVGSQASPPVSPQNFSISGVPNGSYQFVASIDNNNNGAIDAGDFTYGSKGGGPTFTVNGGATTQNLTLNNGPTTIVHTEYISFGVNNTFYMLNLGIDDAPLRAVNVTLISGPNVAVPFDMGYNRNNGTIGVSVFNNATPVVGDSYSLLVTFSDGTTQTLTGSVSGVLGTVNLASGLTATATPSATQPTFSWTAPASLPTAIPFTYRLNNLGFNSIVLPGTAAPLSVDLSAYTRTLAAGSYNWQIEVRDANDNSASVQATTPYVVP